MSQMYGKQRVVIQSNNQIVLAGSRMPGSGGCWSPVGFIYPHTIGEGVHACVLKDKYDRAKGTDNIFARNKKALRRVVAEKYKWGAA